MIEVIFVGRLKLIVIIWYICLEIFIEWYIVFGIKIFIIWLLIMNIILKWNNRFLIWSIFFFNSLLDFDVYLNWL